MRKIIWISGLLLYGLGAIAQPANLGLPPVYNFPKHLYKAGTQNWDIAQDRHGILFFANNEGLLQFDGSFWTCYPIANGTCVRSVHITSDGRIYAGGQGELGYFEADNQGRLRYHSLTVLIPAAQRQFEDVWDIVSTPDGAVWFRTDDRIFGFRNGQMQVFSTGHPLSFLGQVNGQLFVQDAVQGLFRFDGQQFIPFSPAAAFGSPVTGLLPFGRDTVLITTLKSGIFCLMDDQIKPWTTPADAFLRDKRIYSATALKGGYLGLGTSLGGLLILGPDGRSWQLLQKGAGLQNNNVLSVFADRANNIWLGLDNGIDLVEISSPFYRIFPDGALEGTGYAAQVFEQNLYLGTSNGLYSIPWQPYYDPFRGQNFNLVAGSTGQVWGLDDPAGVLLMGHHEGVFAISGNQAQSLSAPGGAWHFLPVDDTTMLLGQYGGLSLFTRQAGLKGWQFRQKLEGLDESCRILVKEDNGTLWVSHPYRGVYRVQLDKSRRKVATHCYGQPDGLPSNLFNYVFKIGGRAVVAAEKGLFRYEPGSERFIPATDLDEWLDPESGRTRYLREDGQGNIWFCQGNTVGVLWVDDEGVRKRVRRQIFPQLNGQLVGGFEHIYPLDARNVFFGTEKGFIHLNPERLRLADTLIEVVISAVHLPDAADSLLFGGFSNTQADITALSYALNSLRFSFSSTCFGDARQVEFSLKLEGLDHDWSTWSDKTERNFAHLPAGKYTFMVKARSASGVESPAVRFQFRIQPPWYASPWAYAAYGLLGILLLFGSFRRQRARFEVEKAALTSEHRQQSEQQRQRMEQSEQEIGRLLQEKLENEVQYKNKELALATMHLVQKGEILTNIQEELQKALEKKQPDATLRNELNRIVRTLQYDTQLDQDWTQFAYHFDQVYGDFLKRLREQNPQLSQNDYRLAAYLRMNLSTKEIAHLMNISVRGVEGSRYRLRKKLNLPNEENLVEFLMNV